MFAVPDPAGIPDSDAAISEECGKQIRGTSEKGKAGRSENTAVLRGKVSVDYNTT